MVGSCASDNGAMAGATVADLYVFGYGSLIFEPTRPDLVADVTLATLPGWRRAFNKRSHARGCPRSAARHHVPHADWHDRFTLGDHLLGLALGTAPGGAMDGALLSYPEARASEVLAAIDRREGHGYVRQAVSVRTERGRVHAWTWLTNPNADLFEPDLDPETTAAILHRATARRGHPKAVGAEYLRHSRQAVRDLDGATPFLDQLLSFLPGST